MQGHWLFLFALSMRLLIFLTTQLRFNAIQVHILCYDSLAKSANVVAASDMNTHCLMF
jgi:hypothetical protein